MCGEKQIGKGLGAQTSYDRPCHTQARMRGDELGIPHSLEHVLLMCQGGRGGAPEEGGSKLGGVGGGSHSQGLEDEAAHKGGVG